MRRILLVVFSFTFTQVSAQLKPIVQDDFLTNIYGWEEDEFKRLLNGTYVINSTDEGEQTFISMYTDEQKDFSLSADFTLQTGLEDGGFGIVWGAGKAASNLFLISSDGDYAVYSGDPDPTQIKTWKHNATIKPLGNLNKLRVEVHSGKAEFYINDTKVDERKSFPFYGNWMGFTTLAKMKLVIDNFLFAQDQNIELPPSEIFSSKKENLGSNINTVEDELGPIISADGKTLFFARQNIPENIGGIKDDEDVWVSYWENNNWTKAVNMGPQVNTSEADLLLSVSSDNNTLIFDEENQLMVRHRTEKGWSALEKMDLQFKDDDHFEASISADGKSIIFSAKLKGNVYFNPNRDESDLYVCIKDKNRWSAPINLGKMINTPGEDISPFLSADGRTLYFASNGRPGYGDHDIFVSTRNGDGWTDWSKPVNLGPMVNTPRLDAYFTVPASGNYAYFVSYSKGFGKADIFRIKLQDNSRPAPVALVKGFVLNSKNNAPLAARIYFENLVTGVEVGEARSDPRNGAYQIILPYGFNYGIRAILKGYYSVNENLELMVKEAYSELQKNLMMVPIEVGETMKLNNVFFDAGTVKLKPESYPELDRLVTILNENPGIHIQLEGHTDNRGNATALLKLSEERIESVKVYLVIHGIDKGRITGQGFGATQPIAKGDTEEDRKKNRRVEFKIIKK